MRRRLTPFIPYLMLALALILRIQDPWPIEQLRLLVFDTYQRMKPRAFDVAKSPVRIVAIDDASLKRIGQFPWPRTVMARMVERLREAGASTIVFDMLFAEPDDSSPDRAVRRWPDTPALKGLKAAAAALPSHDRVMAAAMARTRVVTAFALTAERNDVRPDVKSGFAYAGANPAPVIPAYAGAVTSLKMFEGAAQGNGSISFRPDRDLIIRGVPLFARVGKAIYPGLSAEALRVAAGARGYVVKAVGASGEAGGGIGIVAVRIGPFEIPTDVRGRVLMYYAKSAPERTIPAWRVVEGKLKPDEVRGRIIFIGATAAGLKDLRATSLEAGIAGVEIHAQLIDQVVTKVFLQRPDFARGVELLFTLVAGALVLLLLPRIGAVWAGLLGLVAVAGALGVSWLAFDRFGWLLDPIYPSIAVVIAALTGTVVIYLRSEAERAQVRNAFSRYMSPELVEQLANHPDRLRLGGENRELTMLFCDIRGFTAISEDFTDAADLTGFINRFLTPMTEIILERQGTIDKYMGDAIMAFWNAPIDDPAHARNAARAALAMIDALKRLNTEWMAAADGDNRTFRPVRVGIGINTGIACVGNLGSEMRFDYSVIGDEVNLASRLEGQCKTYAVDIIAGEKTADAIGDFALLEIDRIRVIGRQAPARIFTLLGDAAMAASADFKGLAAAHGAFLAAYRAGNWATALKHLRDARDRGGPALEGLYDVFEIRVAGFRANPPPSDWDGVFEAETK
ncbi:MAG: adenylate/guanylate cyclase domain-containing protein [Alphaproteobacteria bacterium]|nr:adenylate/guanylate cyclase domain-containing protein [Alphaproteobacteria bacterium]